MFSRQLYNQAKATNTLCGTFEYRRMKREVRQQIELKRYRLISQRIAIQDHSPSTRMAVPHLNVSTISRARLKYFDAFVQLDIRYSILNN